MSEQSPLVSDDHKLESEESSPLLPHSPLIRMTSPVESWNVNESSEDFHLLSKTGHRVRNVELCGYGACGTDTVFAGGDHDDLQERSTSVLTRRRTVVCVSDDCSTDLVHCHQREVPGDVDRVARRKLIVAIMLVFVFMIVEILGGLFSGSLAIMTDAAHMMSDLAGYVISLCSMWLSGRKPTKKMSFGFHRAEIVGAVISIQIIWIMSGILVYEAVLRVVHRDYKIDADIMLITAGIGVAVNIIVGIALRPPHGHGHSHGSSSHGHSHGTKKHNHKPENLNVRAAFIHVVGDLCFSIGVLLAAYIIKYKPSWSLADPICTFVFSAVVMITTFRVMKDAVHVLMEGTPPQLSFDDITVDLLSVYGVIAVHNMHIWSLTTDKAALDVHLAINPDIHGQDVLDQAVKILVGKYKLYKTTVQVESYRTTMETCQRCKDPKK